MAMDHQPLCKINIDHLPIKAHYFLYFGGISALWPFIPVLGKQQQISEIDIGVIFLIAPIAGLLSKFIFGAIADKFKKRKMIFFFFILLNLMSFMCIAFLPQRKADPIHPVNLECTSGISYFRQCDRYSDECGKTKLQSIKPETIQEFGLTDEPYWPEKTSLDQPDHEEFETKSSEENPDFNLLHTIRRDRHNYLVCMAQCKISTFVEGVSFCDSVNHNNAPKICSRWSPQMYNGTSVSPDSEDTNGPTLGFKMSTNKPAWLTGEGRKDTGDDVEDNGSYLLKFDVQIKIVDATFVEECVNLPIFNVNFKDDDIDSFEGLSCKGSTVLPDCELQCENDRGLNKFLETINEDDDPFHLVNLWLYGSLVVIGWIAMSVVETFSDVLCFQTLGKASNLYGKQRLWGTIGWGMFSLMTGYLVSLYSKGKLVQDYTPCFYLTGGLLALDLIVSYRWTVKEYERPKSLQRDICMLLSHVRIWIFIGACFIVGMCTGLLWQFLLWHVENLSETPENSSCDHNNSNTKLLQGLILAVQCFGGELPFFFLSGWFLKKLGHVHCMTLVLACFGIRFILYAYITNPWYVLPVELFQGLTYGIFYATMVSYANKISPPGTNATVQGLVQSAFIGTGVSAGSLVGGLLFKNSSGSFAFLVFGIGSLIFGLFHHCSMWMLGRSSGFMMGNGHAEPEGQEMFRISTHDGEADEVLL